MYSGCANTRSSKPVNTLIVTLTSSGPRQNATALCSIHYMLSICSMSTALCPMSAALCSMICEHMQCCRDMDCIRYRLYRDISRYSKQSFNCSVMAAKKRISRQINRPFIIYCRQSDHVWVPMQKGQQYIENMWYHVKSMHARCYGRQQNLRRV